MKMELDSIIPTFGIVQLEVKEKREKEIWFMKAAFPSCCRAGLSEVHGTCCNP